MHEAYYIAQKYAQSFQLGTWEQQTISDTLTEH